MAKEAPLEAHMSAPFQQRVLGEYMEKIRRLGKIPIVKYIGMHYFILAQKR